VLRVYHGGRNVGHRARERALQANEVDVTLVVPRDWPGDGDERTLSREVFRIVELPVSREGDVNRHAYVEPKALRRLIDEVQPDVLDVHEEPFSVAAHQWLQVAPDQVPVVLYTAQNVDKRYPPPFALYERSAHRRATALYPCSRQAASVSRGKGFAGLLTVIPLGVDPALFRPGRQSLDEDEIVLALVGRLVPEKGVVDAVRVLAELHTVRPARLVLMGAGPEETQAMRLADSIGIADRVELERWSSLAEAAGLYRRAHVVLVPSKATETWTEQFGRVIAEAQASGAVVAGYATGSIPEVVDGAGRLVAPGDVEALSRAVVELLADPDQYLRQRKLGLAAAAGKTWDRVAAQQADLYRQVAGGAVTRVALDRSPSRRRHSAHEEFGPPASTTAGLRPFALPVLRRGGTASRLLAAVTDAACELGARVNLPPPVRRS
jgi:glycosyltransferase involved in cell wall biosynthesis